MAAKKPAAKRPARSNGLKANGARDVYIVDGARTFADTDEDVRFLAVCLHDAVVAEGNGAVFFQLHLCVSAEHSSSMQSRKPVTKVMTIRSFSGSGSSL